jgi:hypothetical protein
MEQSYENAYSSCAGAARIHPRRSHWSAFAAAAGLWAMLPAKSWFRRLCGALHCRWTSLRRRHHQLLTVLIGSERLKGSPRSYSELYMACRKATLERRAKMVNNGNARMKLPKQSVPVERRNVTTRAFNAGKIQQSTSCGCPNLCIGPCFLGSCAGQCV